MTQPRKNDRSRKTKLGFLDEHTLDYYRRVYQTLTSDIDGEEKDLFLNNVFAQLETELLRVSQNQSASRYIERLLTEAKRHHVKLLLRAFSTDWMTPSTDRFASHVLQNLIALSPICFTQEKCDDDDETVGDTNIVLEYSLFVEENLETVLSDTYGSHILRVLLEVLGGADVSTDIIRSRLSKNTQTSEKGEWPSKKNPPEEYDSHFKKLVKKIFSTCDYDDHLTDPSSSPVFQTILLIQMQRDPKKCKKYIHKIIKKSGLAGRKETDTESKFVLPKLVQSEVGSYLVEQMVALSIGCEGSNKLYEDIFKGRLLYFTIDKIANYVLQTLINSITEKDLFEEVFDELAEYVEDILAMHHVGLLNKIASGCIRLHTCQQKLVQVLMKAFHCWSPEDRHASFVTLLLSLSTYEVFYKVESEDSGYSKEQDEAASKTAPMLSKINYHGSLLVQNLLKFGKTKSVVISLLQLQPVELKLLSCDRCGSHVIDVFCQSRTVGEKKRDLLIGKMKGQFFDIACDRNGSRTLESMWKTCSTKQKVDIAEELSRQEDKLRSSHFGQFVHRNFAISNFKHRRKQWIADQTSFIKKRKLFQDFLSESDSSPQKIMKGPEICSPELEETNTKDERERLEDRKSKCESKGRKDKKPKNGKSRKENSSQKEDIDVVSKNVEAVCAADVDDDEVGAVSLLGKLVKKHGLDEDEDDAGGNGKKTKKMKKVKKTKTVEEVMDVSSHKPKKHKKKKVKTV